MSTLAQATGRALAKLEEMRAALLLGLGADALLGLSGVRRLGLECGGFSWGTLSLKVTIGMNHTGPDSSGIANKGLQALWALVLSILVKPVIKIGSDSRPDG